MYKIYKSVDDIKKDFYKIWSPRLPIKFIKLSRKYLRKYGCKEDVVFEWASERNAYNIKRLTERLNSEVNVSNPIDADKTFLLMCLSTELFYLPDRKLSSLIVNVIRQIMSTKLSNVKDFKGLDNSLNLWDLYVRSKEYEFDPHMKNIFCYKFLNDTKYINPKYIYEIETIPFRTRKRFDGFLAHLFYAGYKDLYEDMFDILLETIERNVDATMPLIYFLYTFCKVNDKEKRKKVLEVYRKIKSNNKDYNWNHLIKDFYFWDRIDKSNKYNDMPIEELLNK